MNAYWCIATVEELPRGFPEEGIFASCEDEEAAPASGADLVYFIWARAKYSSQGEAIAGITNCLQDEGATGIRSVECICSDAKCMIRRERSLMSEMKEDDVVFLATWLACQSGDQTGATSARDFFSEAMTKRRWQFWK